MMRRVHKNTYKTDRNFRNDSGAYDWAKLQAARKREGLDVPMMFFAVFYDREFMPYGIRRILSGEDF